MELVFASRMDMNFLHVKERPGTPITPDQEGQQYVDHRLFDGLFAFGVIIVEAFNRGVATRAGYGREFVAGLNAEGRFPGPNGLPI